MSETRRQGDEYLGARAGLRFRSAFSFGSSDLFAIDEDGKMWQATWSAIGPESEIEGWRRVKMDVWEEEYLGSK